MISAVCPVYNEERNVERLLDELASKISGQLELIMVYDTDDDTTIPAVVKIRDRYPFEIHLVRNRHGRGPCSAIRTGLEGARGKAVAVVMADLSDDVGALDVMSRLVIEEGYDVVCASRYMRGGRQIGGPVLKRLLSRLAGVSLRYLVGVPTHDVTNSFKVYKREFLDTVRIESQAGFEIGMELVVKAFAAGRRVTEVPTTWRDRTEGTSRFRLWKWIPRYLRWYLFALKARVQGGARIAGTP